MLSWFLFLIPSTVNLVLSGKLCYAFFYDKLARDNTNMKEKYQQMLRKKKKHPREGNLTYLHQQLCKDQCKTLSKKAG